MTENVRLMLREVHIDDIVDGKYDWKTANERRGRLNVFNWLPLLFVNWTTVIAPKGTPCALTTMRGEPLYRYKLYKGHVFFLSMEPSPGFPGS